MKRVFLLIMSVMMFSLAGCGSEGSVSVYIPAPDPIITLPSITNSQFSQDTLNHFIYGSVDFYAPDNDIDTMTISVINSRGFVMERTVKSLTGLTGMTTGIIQFSIDYISYPPETYTFTVYLTDKAGYFSNAIYGTFRV